MRHPCLLFFGLLRQISLVQQSRQIQPSASRSLYGSVVQFYISELACTRMAATLESLRVSEARETVPQWDITPCPTTPYTTIMHNISNKRVDDNLLCWWLISVTMKNILNWPFRVENYLQTFKNFQRAYLVSKKPLVTGPHFTRIWPSARSQNRFKLSGPPCTCTGMLNPGLLITEICLNCRKLWFLFNGWIWTEQTATPPSFVHKFMIKVVVKLYFTGTKRATYKQPVQARTKRAQKNANFRAQHGPGPHQCARRMPGLFRPL